MTDMNSRMWVLPFRSRVQRWTYLKTDSTVEISFEVSSCRPFSSAEPTITTETRGWVGPYPMISTRSKYLRKESPGLIMSWLVESDSPAAEALVFVMALASAKMTLSTIQTSGHKQATARAKRSRALLPLLSLLFALLLPIALWGACVLLRRCWFWFWVWWGDWVGVKGTGIVIVINLGSR